MLSGNIFYHGTIRRSIIAFGRLFSNIYIERKKNDSVNGTLVQTLKVPLAWGPKEKWIQRLDGDPNLSTHTYTSLPRMSFEITGYNYDTTRKVSKMSKIMCNSGTGAKSVFSPVPYNLEIALYVLTKTQEDAMQIIEQILPTFGPEYTLAIKPLSALDIVQDIPITLNNIDVNDEYEGDFQTRRFVTHTLSFTLKLNLFGNVSEGTQILNTTVNLSSNQDLSSPFATHGASGVIETFGATGIVDGSSYEIATVGTTDYTLLGAANNNVGTIFVADLTGSTGAGYGTGTVKYYATYDEWIYNY